MRAPRVYLALEKVASQLAELVALTARFRRTAAEEAPFEAVADR
jgi:hypothetical protein